MSFDGITLNAVKQELEPLLVESRVDRVYQPGKETIILKLRKYRENTTCSFPAGPILPGFTSR